MNSYINAQISNMLQITKSFEQSCELAALQDDGKMSHDEKKTLTKIQNVTQKFRKGLERIM